MRSRRRNLQDIWFCEFTERLDGYDTIKVYSKPEKRRFSVSATSGVTYMWGAGFSLSYDRYITCFDRKFKPKEGTMLFVDVTPELNEDGTLKMQEIQDTNIDGSPKFDENGNPVTHSEYVTVPDYVLKNIHNTKKGRVARFGISKV